jgi:hypothetical protein
MRKHKLCVVNAVRTEEEILKYKIFYVICSCPVNSRLIQYKSHLRCADLIAEYNFLEILLRWCH